MTTKATADLVDTYRDSGRIQSCEVQFRQFGGRRCPNRARGMSSSWTAADPSGPLWLAMWSRG